MSAVRLVIANDHPLVIQGLRHIISGDPTFIVVAICTTGDAVLGTARENRPDILILDLQIVGMSGWEILEQLKRDQSVKQTVVMTALLQGDGALDLLRTGVGGVLLEDSPASAVLHCIREVSAGRQWLDPTLVQRAVHQRSREEECLQQTNALTSRERSIAELVADGLRNKEIANRLKIAEGTVKNHVHSIYEKLGISNRVKLSYLARQNFP